MVGSSIFLHAREELLLAKCHISTFCEESTVVLGHENFLPNVVIDSASSVLVVGRVSVIEVLANNVTLRGDLIARGDSVSVGLFSDSTSGVLRFSGSIRASIRFCALVHSAVHVNIVGFHIQLETGFIDVASKCGRGFVSIGRFVSTRSQRHFKSCVLTVLESFFINASAIESGNGGSVLLWSSSITSFAGRISSTGGWKAGNGGNVEISGSGDLFVSGEVFQFACAGFSLSLIRYGIMEGWGGRLIGVHG